MFRADKTIISNNEKMSGNFMKMFLVLSHAFSLHVHKLQTTKVFPENDTYNGVKTPDNFKKHGNIQKQIIYLI